MKIIVFVGLLIIMIHLSNAVIYKLNDTEYLKMPPKYHLDHYESCLHQPNGTYCYVDISLVSDTPSDLLQMIQEYSEHTPTNFNYSCLHHGICLTKTCKKYIQGNKTVDQRLALEGCLNDSLWRDYKLKTRLRDTVYCRKLDDPLDINALDIAAGAFFILLLMLNIIGSIYDFYHVGGSESNEFLLSFSIKRNWEKLVSHSNRDQSKERLKGINGLRTLSIMLVILAHSPLPFIVSTDNPHGLEKTYNNIEFHIFYNGTLIVQTFFFITGCLLAFNILTYAEKNALTWVLIPKGIMMRWLRLTPAYAVVLIFTATWLRHLASGPLWQTIVNVDVEDCQRSGWLNLLYINNYFDHSQCVAQTWYLASDMQLFILGLFVCILVKTPYRRKIVLIVLFVIGLIAPAIHTYLLDLNAIVIISPETARNFFKDPTFNHSYKRGHTNIPGFIIGLVVGNLIYKGLKDESRIQKFKKLGYLYKLTFPMGVALILSGMLFYEDRPKPSIYLRMVLASILRPIFTVLLTILFIGMVFKFENLYRRFLEWRGWRVPARVSYSAFLIHVAIIRIFTGMKTTLSQMGMAQCLKEAIGMVFLTFLIAYPFWLFVEAPLNQAVLVVLGFAKKDRKEDKRVEPSNSSNIAERRTVIELDGDKSEELLKNIKL